MKGAAPSRTTIIISKNSPTPLSTQVLLILIIIVHLSESTLQLLLRTSSNWAILLLPSLLSIHTIILSKTSHPVSSTIR